MIDEEEIITDYKRNRSVLEKKQDELYKQKWMLESMSDEHCKEQRRLISMFENVFERNYFNDFNNQTYDAYEQLLHHSIHIRRYGEDALEEAYSEYYHAKERLCNLEDEYHQKLREACSENETYEKYDSHSAEPQEFRQGSRL